jgi:predicted permease
MEPLTTSAGRKRVLSGYAVAAVASIGLYALIRHFGERLAPGLEASERVADSLSTHGSILAQVLLALAVITFLARLVGGVFNRYLHQPPVIGEIVAGLMLGPSLLKIVSPSAFAFLLPAEAAPFLSIIAKIGVVLFMFLVGLELDLKALKKSSHTTLAISHASIAVPFLLGSTLALALYPRYAEGHVTFTAFSLFLGISMSVTAFPVLARILTDRAIQTTSRRSWRGRCSISSPVDRTRARSPRPRGEAQELRINSSLRGMNSRPNAHRVRGGTPVAKRSSS